MSRNHVNAFIEAGALFMRTALQLASTSGSGSWRLYQPMHEAGGNYFVFVLLENAPDGLQWSQCDDDVRIGWS